MGLDVALSVVSPSEISLPLFIIYYLLIWSVLLAVAQLICNAGTLPSEHLCLLSDKAEQKEQDQATGSCPVPYPIPSVRMQSL